MWNNVPLENCFSCEILEVTEKFLAWPSMGKHKRKSWEQEKHWKFEDRFLLVREDTAGLMAPLQH